MRNSFLVYAVAITVMSCMHRTQANASPQGFALQECLKKEGSDACYTVDASLNELSGMVAHSTAPDIFWVHNDQGAPRVYAINSKGEILSTVSLDTMDFDDAEEISIGRGPEDGKAYIYVGDIGKERKKAGTVKLFRFKEPSEEELKAPQVAITGAELIRLTYSESKSRDFETQLIDPISGDLFLIEKDGFKVFKAKFSDLMASSEVLSSGSILLEEVRDKGHWDRNPSGGAVSPSGNEILLRNTEKAWVFLRLPGQSLDQALEKPYMTLSLGKEFNGEAITFDNQGLDFYTVSENTKNAKKDKTAPQPVSHYKRLN